jgi:bifunctional polynucleotide phosphatase/kinase
MVVLVGIPGSGKSTLAKSRYPQYKRTNLDSLGSRHKEDIEISIALVNGKDIVIDNTNTTRKSRRKYIELAKTLGLQVDAVYLKCPLDVALLRNSRRIGKEHVPDRAIIMYHRILQEPTLDEGFDSVEVEDTSNQDGGS